MRATNTMTALSAACCALALATSALAQDDLNDLLSLDGEKPAAKADAKPAAPAAAAKEEAKAETPAPAAEAKEEAKAEEKAEAPKEEAKAEPKEEPKAEEKAEEKVAEVEEKTEEKAEEKAEPKEETKAEEKVAEAKPEVKPAAEASALSADDAKLISDMMAASVLSREALDKQAEQEIGNARTAMEEHDYEVAFRQYSFALVHLSQRPDAAPFRKECEQGMAQARYLAAKQALKEDNRDRAKALAKEARDLNHPQAGALLASLESEAAEEAATDVADIKHRRNDPDYKADRDTIRKRIRLSSQYLAVADLANALDQVDLVLRSDPYNAEAIALRDRIQRKRELIIDKEREATRKGMIADVGAAWRPVYAVNSADLKTISSGTAKSPLGGDGERSVEQSIEKRMKEMMLPAISFRPPATIIDAVDYFRQASKDYDRPEVPVDQRGFNFVLQLDKVLTSGGADAGDAKPAAGNANAFSSAADDEGEASSGDVPVIPNVTASNISLYEALKLVCQVCKPAYKFKVQGSVVMVMPKTMTTDELVTRTYSVVESFVDRMNDASNSLKDTKAGEFGGGDEGGDGASPEDQWKNYFADLGVTWPQNSRIKYIKAVGKLRVTNTEDQLAILEDALNELNVTPSMIEIETRFVEVAQEDLNSLGFEWLLNSDYSFNVGGKLAKALNLKDGAFGRDSNGNATGWSRWHQNGDLVTDKNGNSFIDSWSKELGTETVTKNATETFDNIGQVIDTGSVNSGETKTSSTQTKTITQTSPTWFNGASPDYRRYSESGKNKTGRNMGVTAIDGSTYQTGMRYLSTEGNHISGEGESTNDRFMKVNAFLGNADLSMILHMFSQRSDTDLLSAPKVVTKSGNEAVIKVVTIYRFPQDYDVTIQSTSSGSSTTSVGSTTGGSDGKILPMVEPQNFEQQEVGVILTVTPELSPEGLINLALEPKVISEPTWKDYGMKVPMSAVMSSAAQTMALASGNEDMNWFNVPMEQPFFKERSINTHVTLYNGSTIVMGGLITEERKSMEDKIPFLGDIPFLGRFFRSRSEWSNKRNLLIFVSARLVDPNGRQIIQNQDADTSASAPAAEKASKPTPAPKAE